MNKSIFTLFLAVFFFSCKNYYNDTIYWMKTIPDNTNVAEVKKLQPHFVEIEWNSSEIIENRNYYTVVKIKGSRDVLNMTHLLIFENDQYKGFTSLK